MITFANPHLLYLLLIIPLALLLFLWTRYSREHRLAKFGKPANLRPLMPDASKYVPWVRFSLIMVILAALVIILARPIATTTQEVKTEETKSRGIEIMICLDVSRSMLASSTDDPQGINRLERAKHILERLIGKMRDDKVGLIVLPEMPTLSCQSHRTTYRQKCLSTRYRPTWCRLRAPLSARQSRWR